MKLTYKKLDYYKNYLVPFTYKKKWPHRPILLITLNFNILYFPTERQKRVAEQMNNENLFICCLQETQQNSQNEYILMAKRCKTIIQAYRKKVDRDK